MAGKRDFVWYELVTADLDGAAAFYRDVVGWTVDEVGGPGMRYLAAGMGPAWRGVAGMMEMPEPMRAAGAPAQWMGYLYSDDVDATVEAVRAAGGRVCREPAEIPGVGRFAALADPQGAVFQLLQPKPHGPVPDPVPAGKPGSVAWCELMTSDAEAAWRFYAELFEWTPAAAIPMGEAGVYQTFSTNDQPMSGGMMTVPPWLRAEMPPAMWHFYFAVESIGAAKARVEAGGGTVVHGPAQVPGGGWILNATDPQGVRFSLTGPA